MANSSSDVRSRIDEFLPRYDFCADYEIGISAPSSIVYGCLLGCDFNEKWVVRLLMSLRSCKRVSRNQRPTDFRQRLPGTGFVVLEELPNEELVIGVAGRFWRLDGGRCLDLRADDFVAFSRPGDAKAAWNFRLRPGSDQSTMLSTETRIQCFGSAGWKFRMYWILVGPFSGLIRKAILQQVKTKAEASVSASRDATFTSPAVS